MEHLLNRRKHIWRGELVLLAAVYISSMGVSFMIYSGAGISAISSVPYEFALAELESEADAKAAAEIFQARIDSQVAGGAFYPDTIAGWEKAAVITQGNVAALICANTEQDAAADAFRALFQ